ncbi:glycosyltransferase family 2 protein [Butyrivibrio sp. XPD2006]|uniref:glycosyltransferase family 2 protein n=1 Tax=Butyrivibrio sp. XPD2006 TaxID=1280668 RepID=UPI0003B4BDED|nr:glycosyltransferase family 2 protein [Butyrivibrio sp. XPD2006]
MNRDKLLSIIIPAYNAEKYILPCLKSMKDLIGDDLEILVINDGSRDNTEAIVTEYAGSDNRVKLISIPNGGVSKARNTGIENAQGRYIMFLDSDDYLISDVFGKLEKLIKHEDYDFAAFSRDIIEEDGRIWTEGFPFKGNETDRKEQMDLIMYADSLFNECWGKLYKKSIIDEFGIRFPVGIPVGEDLMFVTQFYSHCKRPYAVNKSLVAYRQHGESAMKKYGITDRLKYTQDLYLFSKNYIPENITGESMYHNFKVLTNLCREYSKDSINKDAIKTIYSNDMAVEVMAQLDSSRVPMFRKHEYFMMKHKMLTASSIYYFFKAKAD